MIKKDNMDIQIIGSDISLNAIETSTNNIEYGEIDNIV
jgi:methylase of polypeptide subunit release factors